VWYADRRAERAAAERRESEARLAGERDAEARNKAEQARAGVRAALALAADLRGLSRFGPTGAALGLAAARAAGGAPEQLADVERARVDLAFATELDDIRYRKWAYVAAPGGGGDFSLKTAAPRYRVAFAARGLDLTALPPAEAAARLAASDIKAELVAAVDDWALFEPDEKLRNRLLEVARRADPGAWGNRLRDPRCGLTRRPWRPWRPTPTRARCRRRPWVCWRS
jgi:hypothetical protein